ncbi:MAG: hypothetical protein K8T90_08250 [Planctomycetes bacterium]|nr:hypothetical protein [Planctomycetota bacterium]
MTPATCAAARSALVRAPDDSAAPPHLAGCAPCRAFAARVSRVDAALDADRAAAVPVPATLRARILAAACATAPQPRAAQPPAFRGRILELAARAAAVAAVLVAGLWLAPEPVFAEDVDLAAIRLEGFDIQARLADLDIAPRLAEHVRSIPDIVLTAPPESPVDPMLLASAAVVAAALIVAASFAPSRGAGKPTSRRS